jgi:hypothetical protein
VTKSTLREKISDPSWVLDPITEIEGVKHALILSADGIVVGASDSLSREDAEGTAAMVSALHGSSRAATVVALGAPKKTPISTITVQLDAPPDSKDRTSCGTLMVMPAGTNTNAFIAVSYGPEVPLSIIAHTMAKQAKNLGEALMSVSARTDGSAS